MTAWLLTWLWQGVALAVSLSIAMHLLPRVNAATRHVVWWGAFAALIFLGWQSLPSLAIAGALAPGGVAAAGAPAPAISMISVQPLPVWALSLISMLWASVALFRLLRIFPGLHALYRLKDACRPLPRTVEERLPLWLESKGRRVRLMLCDRLNGAALLGLHDPVIAIPSSLVGELSAGDLDQIILHEYGHAQRRDDWMRLVQTLLEAALWMHPAAFLIGRELNLEREVACDDWVIARTASPKIYAGCLSRVAERCRSRAVPAFAQPLFGGHRDLFRRVDRLLDAKRNSSRRPSLPAAAACMTVIAACAVQLRAFPLVTDAAMTPMAMTSVPVVSGLSRTDTPVVSGFKSVVRLKPDTTDTTVRLKPDTTGTTVRLPAASRGPGKPDATDTTVRLKPDTTNEAVRSEPNATELAPVLLRSSVFEGIYPTAHVATSASPVVTPWQVAGNAGLGIGMAATKASVGLANHFTRAGTAIARRF